MLTKNNELDNFTASYKALLIYNEAMENNVDPYLAISIAIQENKTRHTTERNNKNAVGMFQLTPIVEKIYSVDGEILEENIKGAMEFLADLKVMYKGDVKLVLAHYNAGSWPQEKLDKNYGGVKDYVGEILERYEMMKNKYK
ncbi:MAG: transglycosylase SLT domain-containing protein [archaeon]